MLSRCYKLDYDGSFDSSDTVSAFSCAVVVAISDVLVIRIACQSNPPLLCFIGLRTRALHPPTVRCPRAAG